MGDQQIIEAGVCPFCGGHRIHDPENRPENVVYDSTEHCLQCGLWSCPNAEHDTLRE